MRICLFEDGRTADLNPLALTRPVADLICGLTPLGEKHARFFAAEVVGHLVRPEIAELLRSRDEDVPVNDPAWTRLAPTVLVNARWLPPQRPRISLAPSFQHLFRNGPFLGTCGGEPAFAVLDQRLLQTVAPTTIDDCLADWLQSLPTREVGGNMIRYPWELIDHNATQLIRDFEATCDSTDAGFHPTGFALVGPAERLLLHPSARIDPMVVADTTHGPVWVGPGAVVTAFTRLEGPCGVGTGTHLLGAKIRAGTTLGPQCRVGGEVECSIIQGFTNKYHDGFLGHSYVGEWVNLAAGASTSDLRCNYREVTVPVNGVETPSGHTKVGSFIGDHARTGMNVMLNCGSVIGPFATLFPTGQYAARDIPAFARFGPGGLSQDTDAEELLATAGVVMKRRGREMTPQLESLYRTLVENRRPAAVRSLRKSA